MDSVKKLPGRTNDATPVPITSRAQSPFLMCRQPVPERSSRVFLKGRGIVPEGSWQARS